MAQIQLDTLSTVECANQMAEDHVTNASNRDTNHCLPTIVEKTFLRRLHGSYTRRETEFEAIQAATFT